MNPNAKKAETVGQDRQYKDATEACDAAHGTYDASKAKTAKPATPGPGTLPNTPNPFALKG